MYYIIFKFLTREPKKAMNFVRDIAIPIILLLAVGAIILSVNTQLTNLLTLGGESDVIVVRNTNTSIEQSIIPASALKKLPHINIEKIVPVIYQNVPVIIKNDNFSVHSSILFLCVNITDFNDIIPFHTLQTNQIVNMSNNSAIIGSQIASELQLNQNDIKNYQIYIPDTNTTFKIGEMDSLPDITVNEVIINNNSIHSINKTFTGNYYSELLIKVNDKTKIVGTANEIQNVLNQFYPTYNCNVFQGSGTSSLLHDVVAKIVQQLFIFNLILDIIIVIRVIQSLLWIAQDYEYELNELKILGASRNQIYILFMILAVVVGNLGFILAVIGSILIPTGITFLMAIVTLQPATVQPPTIGQIFTSFWQINLLTIIVALYPAYRLSSKKIIRQKERE